MSNQDGAVSLANQLHVALDAGFQHIDAAEMYETEQFTGPAFQAYLARTQKSRQDYYLTGKLWRSIPDVDAGVAKSLSYFGTDYLDLYLLHAPFLKEKGLPSSVAEVWAKMET
jgi:diketogulonate reductase-like aldo/keto reductase